MTKQLLSFVQISLLALAGMVLVINYQDVFAAKGHKSAGKSKKHAATGDVWERVRHGLRIPVLGPTYYGADTLLSAPPVPASVKKIASTYTTATVHEDAGSIQDSAPETSARLTTVISPKSLYKGGSQFTERFRSKQTITAKNSKLFNKNLSLEERYTPLGRKKLAPKTIISEKSTQQTAADPATGTLQTPLVKSPLIERIRTRLNFHPELTKKVGGPGVAGASNPATSDKTNAAGGLIPTQTAVSNCADLGRKEIIKLAQQGMLPQSYYQVAEQCRLKKSIAYERVNQQIASYSHKMGFVNQSTERARPYLYHIVDALTKYGMPYDIALLPIVESGYQPTAMSPMSAAGVWQFIPSTGRDFGLEQNEDYDARMDITAATQAALRFLSGLKDRYHGDWLLALAAYNCGPGNVDAAIARNKAAGLDTDFWSLALPAETQDYVPRLLALAHIFANPAQYGLKLRPISNEPYFIKIAIDREFDIQRLFNKDFNTIAKLAGFSSEEFGFLNTAYLKSAVIHSRPFSLLMPINNANQLHESLAFIAKSESDLGKQQLPDNLLVEINPETTFSEFVAKIEQPLLAIDPAEITPPTTQIRQFITDFVATDKEYLAIHYLDKGETLKSIADSHGVSETALREFNKIKHRQKIGLGHRLLIPSERIAQQNHHSILFKANKKG